jgi:hypothetical protein
MPIQPLGKMIVTNLNLHYIRKQFSKLKLLEGCTVKLDYSKVP